MTRSSDDGIVVEGLAAIDTFGASGVGVEEKVAFLEGRVVEQSNTLGGIREAMVSLAKMSRQFMWLAGMLLTTLVAVVAALVTR